MVSGREKNLSGLILLFVASAAKAPLVVFPDVPVLSTVISYCFSSIQEQSFRFLPAFIFNLKPRGPPLQS